MRGENGVDLKLGPGQVPPKGGRLSGNAYYFKYILTFS